MKRGMMWAFAIISALALGTLLVSIVSLLRSGQLTGYAVLTSLSYLAVALGFLFIITWAFLRGQFRDVEAPKYKVLELEKD
jgi:nitrogen fixation-related uncharacterized protein